MFEDLSDVDSLREKIAIRVYEIRELLSSFRQPMFRHMLSEEGYPCELQEIAEFPAGNATKHYYIKGVYQNPKGAVQMAKWRADDGVAIIIVQSGKLLVYSAD